MWHTLVVTIVICLFVHNYAADPTPIAANLMGVADYARSLPFVDLVKQSRQFGTPNSPWDGKCQVDALGWPTEDFGVILADGDLHMEGDYALSGHFNAQPKISPVASGGVSVNDVSWNANTKLLTATISVTSSAVQIMLGFTGTSGGVRDLQFLLPNYTQADANGFTREWKAMLSKFVLFRYMDWASTNGNPIVEWSDRTLPSHPSYTFGNKGATGVPWEVCIALANEMGKDMWINVPHQANDDYVKQLATLFKAQLNSNLNLYVEYSNEVWNWGFSQATWNLDAAVAEVNAGDPNRLNYDGVNNKWYWGYRRVALRLKQITDTFASVWGSDAINTRVRPVLAGQVVQSLICRLGLDYINAVYGNPKKWFYAIAGAPYFNLGDLNNKQDMTVEQVLDALKANIDSINPAVGVGNNNFLASNLALAKWYGLEFRGYEGGPDTFGPNGIDAKANATKDPRMKDLVISYLNNWVSYGFGPLNWFSAGAQDFHTQYGTWGLTDDMSDQNQPKIQGIDAVRLRPPAPLAIGTSIPATLNATNFVDHPVPLRDPYLRWLGVNSTFDYLVKTSQAGQHKITVWTAGTVANALLGVNVNNVVEQVLTAPNTGDEQKFAPTASVTFNFDAGINVIKLRVLTARGYNIGQVQVD